MATRQTIVARAAIRSVTAIIEPDDANGGYLARGCDTEPTRHDRQSRGFRLPRRPTPDNLPKREEK